MLITVAAAWVGLSLPISMGVGRLIRNRYADDPKTTTASTPTFAELYKRAFPTATIASAYGGHDTVGKTVSVCMN